MVAGGDLMRIYLKCLEFIKPLGDVGSSFSDVLLILEKAVSDQPNKEEYRLQRRAHIFSVLCEEP